MIWILLLLLAGCIQTQDPNLILFNQSYNQYLQYLENHSSLNYSASWQTLTIIDNKTKTNKSISIYKDRLILSNHTYYSIWAYPNETCYQMFDMYACENDNASYRISSKSLFWTPMKINREKAFLNALLSLPGLKVKTLNNTTFELTYNYSKASYQQLQQLGISISAINRVGKIILIYEFYPSNYIKRVEKTVYLNNGTVVKSMLLYSKPSFNKLPPVLNGTNMPVSYVKLGISYLMNLPKSDMELRNIAINEGYPFLCKFAKNQTVCFDAYITKTKNTDACKYTENPEACYQTYGK